jgi:hypothetical protein
MYARALLFVLVAALAGCTPSPIAPPPSVTSTAGLSTVAIATATPTPRPLGPPPVASTVPTAPPQPALDARSATLIAVLDDWCASGPPLAAELPLPYIGQLADGRSAREVAAVLGRSSCGDRLRAVAYGDGASEVVTVGAYMANGAILWVDRGYWRIASVPVDYGYLELRWDVQRANERELFFTTWSGGSAGARGFVAVGISGAAARLTLHTYPTASEMGAQRVAGDQVLVTGRKLPVRPWGINSNCCLPGGHEWLWRWTASGYVLVAERQDRDSYFAVNALLGAIDSGHPETAADVATGPAIEAATSLLGPGRLWNYKASANAGEQERAELFRWSALPGPAPVGPAIVRYQVSRYEPAGPNVLITLERIGDGWMATDVTAGSLP